MALSVQDAQAIAAAARRLGVDPGTLGGLMELESGVDPNIWGGAGGRYRGLIQFGPEARKEVGLPDKPMSISEQMPYVEKYFQQRGFTPGKHGATELYRTVLVGNPHQSGTDSFGTNSDRAAQKMLPGGEYYERFKKKFDPAFQSGGGSTLLSAPSQASPRAAVAGASAAAGGGLLAGILKNAIAEIEGSSTGSAPSTQKLNLGGLLSAAVRPFGERGGGFTRRANRKASGPEFLGPIAKTEGAWDGVESQGIPNVAALAGSLIAGLMGESAPQATGQIPMGSGGGAGGSLVDAGKAFERVGLRVREHPSFGGVGGHSHGSLHYKGLALDLTDWQDPGESEASWKPRKKYMGEQLQALMGGSAEIFHPGNDPKGHPTHIHFGVPSGKLNAEQLSGIARIRQDALKRYPLRWAG